MLIVLDSGAIINDESFRFLEGHHYVITPLVDAELKDQRSKSLMENALSHDLLEIIEPEEKFVKKVQENIKKIGMRLSKADVSVLALAEQLKERKPTVISDDYSVQNYCRHHNFSFQGAIMGEIKKAKTFLKKGKR
jgi:rRNA maturation endonuclease Nob1